MGENVNRHVEISNNLLKLSKKLLKEGKKNNDEKITNLAVMFLVINGVFLDDISYAKLFNLLRMFSRSELFESLMETELRDDIVRLITSFAKGTDDFDNLLDDINE